MFDYLDELNDNQFQAVTTNKQKVLVVAGAGSGKTRVLTTRIQYLLDKGADKDVEDNEGNKAIHYVRKECFEDLKEMLK